MTDLELLDTYGPPATILRSDVLERARLDLLGAAATDSRQDPVRVAVGRRPSARRRFAVGGLLAASVAAGAVFLPSALGVHGSTAIALVSVEPLTFPLTPRTVPPELTDAVFELSSGFQAVRYVGRHGDRLSVTTGIDTKEFWSIPDDSRPIDIDGQPGVVFEGSVFHGTPASTRSVSVVWQNAEGAWTRVSGEGRYADTARMESFAESLLEQPQRVDLSLQIAPRGWSVEAYKEDRVLMLSPDEGPAGVHLTVSVLDHLSADFVTDYGASDVSTALVHGRDAKIGRIAGGWIVEARTPGGQAFSVSAPATFTRAQLVEIADAVSYSP